MCLDLHRRVADLDDLVLFLLQLFPERVFQFLNTQSADRRDAQHLDAEFLLQRRRIDGLFGLDIAFGDSQYACLGQQFGVVFLQFAQENLILFDLILACGRHHKQ